MENRIITAPTVNFEYYIDDFGKNKEYILFRAGLAYIYPKLDEHSLKYNIGIQIGFRLSKI